MDFLKLMVFSTLIWYGSYTILPCLSFTGLPVLAQLGRTPLEHFAALHQDGALGIGNDVGAVHLHQIRLEPEAGLAGTAAADDQHVLVAGILGVLGTGWTW